MKEFLRKRYPMTREPLPRDVLAAVSHYRHGERLTWHQHQHGQLVMAVRGVVRVLTPDRTWTLPQTRAVWLPSDVDHELHAVGELDLCNVYIEPQAFPWVWREPSVIHVSALVRELALTLSAGGNDYSPGSQAALCAPLLLRALADTSALPASGVPLPSDDKLLVVCEHMMNDPACGHTLDFWGAQLGASGRTLARRFKDETGLTFNAWRQQLRVSEAMTRLALGHSVSRIAKEFGYSSASAFITMFKQSTGEAPQRYLKSQ